ncbi:hypothetical protein LH128_05163 [Sphingomonas sp. LH128]|uniref:hypothetical protein n=1 Tax=Sphingomonas sp. LH128 TaxID=473781 RepID=UPI00027C9B14|nr:hypothetical protein [Sphingomonas sp. LH128]EJU14121.1 hypothetical protein LH128_05163 [Sphingomonas sp. LH128]
MGRKLRFPEKREAAFEAGTLARIQAVLKDGEDRTTFIREAVEREVQRREFVKTTDIKPLTRGTNAALAKPRKR